MAREEARPFDTPGRPVYRTYGDGRTTRTPRRRVGADIGGASGGVGRISTI